MCVFFGRAKREAEKAETEKASKRARLLANLDPRSRLDACRDNFILLTNSVPAAPCNKVAPRSSVSGAQYKLGAPRKAGSAKLVSPPESVSPVAKSAKCPVNHAILVTILQHLDNPADLKAAITSSPAMLAAFQSSRATVLKSVINNAIPANALGAMLGLYHCPRFVAGCVI